MTSEAAPTVAVFGLGEAGSLIAADLVIAGAEVRGFDPASVQTPPGVTRFEDPNEAFPGVDLVMAITAAADARTAMEQAWEMVDPPVLYADLASASPALKGELAGIAAAKNVPFVDVALMAPVPGSGLATPALASGPGSSRYADVINGLGGSVEPMGGEAGRAAGRKLMRSIVTKGLTALLMESMDLARARDDEEWLWSHLVDQLSSIDQALLLRLLEGAESHAVRRLDEMEAARELLDSVELPAPMTSGTLEVLRRVAEEGMPESRS